MTSSGNGAEPLLSLRGVSKNFGPVQALGIRVNGDESTAVRQRGRMSLSCAWRDAQARKTRHQPALEIALPGAGQRRRERAREREAGPVVDFVTAHDTDLRLREACDHELARDAGRDREVLVIANDRDSHGSGNNLTGSRRAPSVRNSAR